MKRLRFLYPLFFVSFPILAVYTHNIERIRFNKIIMPFELSIAITIGLWFLLNSLIRNRYKTSLLTTYFLILFYSYGHAYNILEQFFLKYSENQRNIGLFIFWLFLLWLGGYRILKLGKKLEFLTGFFNTTGIMLILISLIQIAGYRLNYGRELINYSNLIKSNNQSGTKFQDIVKKPDKSPDIYYIILDGYANNEALKSVYGYDNSDFENFLRNKGFIIDSRARSNYSLTFLSLASSLNMKYVNYLADVVGFDSADRGFAFNMIKDNEVLRILKSKGYLSVHFSSGWGGTDSNKFADTNIYCGKINQFATTLLLTTMLRPFEGIYLPQNTRERILCTFSQLASIREDINGPIFVFSHIISPHPPFVFGANGEEVKVEESNDSIGLDSWQNKQGYINQLIFINKKVKELINKLTTDKNNLPIIIIQADHGSALTPGMEINNPDLIQERMRPFIALMFPNKQNVDLNAVTPVNIFRLVFNNYFDAKYELLENMNYFSNYEKPYHLIDVTQFVKPN